ncbi:MAG: enoyl-CoA hydratase/isomerase family protein [Deltaproteobacteria bacterium]|nr:enoyl-CoA hydratase/isomerase family protein [Deltaproteobacteria bacterium]
MTTNKTTCKNLILDYKELGIQIVKISRIKQLNALNTETLEELKETLQVFAKDTTVRVVILTGDGDKAFIAGADIAEMKDMNTSQGVRFSRLGHDVAKLLEQMPKPTIAAVNGFALGGGTEMAIACDFIIASENAVFGQPEVGLGIIPGFGANFRLPKFVGLPRAKELIFSGRRVKADEAFRIGLASFVYPVEGFLSKVIEFACEISQKSSEALRASKKTINELSETNGLNAKLDAEAQTFGTLFSSYDQKEGMSAFVEKRKPKFQGL